MKPQNTILITIALVLSSCKMTEQYKQYEKNINTQAPKKEIREQYGEPHTIKKYHGKTAWIYLSTEYYYEPATITVNSYIYPTSIQYLPQVSGKYKEPYMAYIFTNGTVESGATTMKKRKHPDTLIAITTLASVIIFVAASP